MAQQNQAKNETHVTDSHAHSHGPWKFGSLVSKKSVPTKDHIDGNFEGSFAAGARSNACVNFSPWYKRRDYLLGGWTNVSIWRGALIECVASSMLCYLSGQIGVTLQSYGTPQIGGYVGISNIVLLSIFIYAISPASGGHINPLISWTTSLSGLCPVSRAVLYMLAQLLGSALAGGVLLGALGTARADKYHGGGCFYDPKIISTGQVLLIEVYSSFTLTFLAFGVGLDPRQAKLFGPHFGPLLVGMTLGIVSFATTGTAPGYTGASMNPTRCFAFAVATRNFQDQWIWWVGAGTGGLLNALLYNLVPPYSPDRSGSSNASNFPGQETQA